jgi:hypothetical protein
VSHGAGGGDERPGKVDVRKTQSIRLRFEARSQR